MMPTRRNFINTGLIAAAGLTWPHAVVAALAGQTTLANGIPLSGTWPPRYAFGQEPKTPPYLVSPPAVLPIDAGRQLFVDDFLIERTTLRRIHHRPAIRPEPVLKADRPWELGETAAASPTAAVFSDAVIWDDAERVFKMWYMGGYTGVTCYATSPDGIHWTKPRLDVVPGTNIVNPAPRDSSTVWVDRRAAAGSRFKMACSRPGSGSTVQQRFVSPDGIHWTLRGETPTVGDRTTFFYNPFRDRWVFSIRDGGDVDGRPRHRRYVEVEDFDSATWTDQDAVYWVAADDLDPRREDLKSAPQLYNLDCAAYESVLVGLFSIWRGEASWQHKHVDICLGFSRDGFHWTRDDRQPFIAPRVEPDSWYRTNVQSAGGCCAIVGDELYFYFSGRSGRPDSNEPGATSTGLAILRRDGFVSMRAAAEEAELTTRPLTSSGRYLFVNADCAAGELRAEILDRAGQPIPGFSRAECVPFRGNSTRAPIGWTAGADLSRAAAEPVTIRFVMSRGDLFSFWIARERQG